MRKMTLLLLLLTAVPACKEPLFDTTGRESTSTDRTTPPPMPPDTTRTEEVVHATAIVFPDSVDWRKGDTRGGKLVLFENDKALGSLALGDRPDANRHRYLDGHLWTDATDGATTTLSCDGSPFFSFPGQETLVGFLVADGSVHTLGQHPGGGVCYRVDGQEVFSSPQGTAVGSLYADGKDICYTYALPVQGEEDQTMWEYRVMQGGQLLKTVPALSGVQLYDIRVHGGEVYRLEYRYSRVCLLRGENLTPLDLSPGSRNLRLVVVDGEVLVKGLHYDGWDGWCWLRDAEAARYEYYARWRYLHDIYAEEGEMAVVVLDLDDCVVKVLRGDMEVNLDFETYRLHTSRCVAYRKGMIALALTGDAWYDENILVINDRILTVPFNGYFTGIYF